MAPNFGVGTWYWKSYAQHPDLDPELPLKGYSADQWQTFMYQEPTKIRVSGINMTYEGLIPRIRRMYLNPEKEPGQKHIKEFAERIATFRECPECGGGTSARTSYQDRTDRRRHAARGARLQITDLRAWWRSCTPPLGPSRRRAFPS